MDFKKYLSKNNIKLRKNVVQFCEEGLDIMNSSRDIMHKRGHVDRMLTDLARYKNKKPVKDAEFEVLITAICWHDTWKAIKGSGGLIKTGYQQVMEGLLCAKFFRKKAKGRLDPGLIKNVIYVIRKHSEIQILPPNTLESKILNCLDSLDKWSSERIKNVKSEYFATKSRFMFYLFKKYMLMDKGKDLSIEVFNEEYWRRQEDYFEAIEGS